MGRLAVSTITRMNTVYPIYSSDHVSPTSFLNPLPTSPSDQASKTPTNLSPPSSPTHSHSQPKQELQRKVLEQLMGPEAMGIVQVDISMWDPKVCRPFIAGICPHDLFTNTKMDLGSCNRTHSNKVKAEFATKMAAAVAEKDLQKIAELNRLTVEYEQNIMSFVDECDRRIRAAQRRLEKTPEENNRTTALMREIGEIEGAYQAAMGDVEKLGSEGKVEESMKQLANAEALKTEKQDKERELQNLTETSGASGHQKLRVCDICGAYLSILDSDRRLADHFGGKMHLGYLQLRTSMDDWRTRGALPTATHAPKPIAPPPSSAPKPVASTPSAPVAFRPIPSSMLASHGAPSGFVPASSSGGSENRPAGDSSRDSGRDHRSGGGSSRHDERDRDRGGSSSRREGEHRSSSSRYDDNHSSSRREDERRHSSRREEDERRHSSRREEDDKRSSSSRRTTTHEEGERSSSRRTYEDGEERSDKEKRRRVD